MDSTKVFVASFKDAVVFLVLCITDSSGSEGWSDTGSEEVALLGADLVSVKDDLVDEVSLFAEKAVLMSPALVSLAS